jgi:hypothetical protein
VTLDYLGGCLYILVFLSALHPFHVSRRARRQEKQHNTHTHNNCKLEIQHARRSFSLLLSRSPNMFYSLCHGNEHSKKLSYILFMTTNAERTLLRTARALFLANVLYVISHPLYLYISTQQRDMKTNKVKKKILRRRHFYSATSSTFTEYKSAKIRLFSESGARQGRAKKEKETFSAHCAPRRRRRGRRTTRKAAAANPFMKLINHVAAADLCAPLFVFPSFKYEFKSLVNVFCCPLFS